MNRRKRFTVVVIAVFFLSACVYGGFAIMKTGEVNVIKAEPAEAEVKNENYEESKPYMIKEYLGNIGIYQKGGDDYILVNIVDANVTLLPEADVDSLKKGIYIENEQQLLMLIEDFTS